MNPKTVIVIAGLPTTGKSTLGRAIAKATGLHFIDIDKGPVDCAPQQESNPYRSDEARTRERARMTVAYAVLHAAVEANLTHGFSVIISATYSRHSNQDFLSAAVDQGGGNLKIVWCQYNDTPDEIKRRIDIRLASGAIGGCRSVDHYLDDKSRYAGIKLPHIVVMMEGAARRASAEPSNRCSYTSIRRNNGIRLRDPLISGLSRIRFKRTSARGLFLFKKFPHWLFYFFYTTIRI